MREAVRYSPPGPTWRDPWAWAAAGAVLACVAAGRGAAWGEPINDDFYFIRHALLQGPASWFDGGGVRIYWRPLARQLYYAWCAPLMLSHPGAIAILHAILLALTSLILYRTFRLHFGGPASAAIATFPALAEASRMLITWPSHFQDLGALLFAAVALHEIAHRRRISAAAALLASLLCKEVFAATALLLPWMPAMPAPPGAPSDDRQRLRERLRDTAVVASVLVCWTVAYVALLRSGAFSLSAAAAGAGASWAARAAWAWSRSLAAAFSLGIAARPWHAGVWAAIAVLAVAGIAAIARGGEAGTARGAVRADARGTVRAEARRRALWALWGCAWFLAASLNQAQVYPDWSANRTVFGSLGVGVALVPLLEAAHPALVVALVVVRLATLGLSPGAPRVVASREPPTGAAFDFAHLTRLQRLVRDTREALVRREPRLPRGARVGWLNLPHMATYSFAGDLALQSWYRDTTLAWIPASEFQTHPELAPVVFLMYQSRNTPQIVPVTTDAIRTYFEGTRRVGAGDYDAGLAALVRADSLGGAASAGMFGGAIRSARAVAYYDRARYDDAAREAAASVESWPENAQAHMILASVAVVHGDPATAREEVARGLAIDPHDPDLRALARRLTAGGPGRRSP